MTAEPSRVPGQLRIVINPNSGRGWADDPAEQLRQAIPGAEVVELDDDGGRSPDEVIRQAAAGAAVLGVCGGDGTVSCAAAVAIDRGIPLLVVPGGTLNHFAKDLGIESVDDAADAARQRRAQRVDAAEIAGRVYLNNASIGLYPELVATRERWEGRVGKWLALVAALVAVLPTAAPVQVEIDGRRLPVWFAFFGNCRYERQGVVTAPGRDRMDDGVLDVRVVRADRRAARTRAIGAALARRLDRSPVLEAWTAERVAVRVLDGPGQLAADGEVFSGPAAFEVVKRPVALTVLVPGPGGPESTGPLDPASDDLRPYSRPAVRPNDRMHGHRLGRRRVDRQ